MSMREALGWAGAHMGQVAWKKHQPRPVEADLHREAHIRPSYDAAFFFRGLQPLHHRSDRIPDGANDSPASDNAAISQPDALKRGGGDPRIEHEIDARLLHFFSGEFAQPGCD